MGKLGALLSSAMPAASSSGRLGISDATLLLVNLREVAAAEAQLDSREALIDVARARVALDATTGALLTP